MENAAGLPADRFDRRLLAAVERSVPLVPRPFAQLADELGADERRVIGRVAELSAPGGVIREIAGVFDAAALGYRTTLVAARCQPHRLDAAGRTVAGHPGVSHCYARRGELNLWFTLSVPPTSHLGLAGTVDELARRIGAERVLLLPAIRRYKLRVVFAPDAGYGGDSPGEDLVPRHAGGGAGPRLSDEQVRAVRALLWPLPAVREPFDAIGAEEGLTGDDVLVHAADFLAVGYMRRYAAVLRHRAAGAAVNVLVAWQVPAGRADFFGAQAGGFVAVSHCYLRATGEGWPYNVYTMIHSPDAAGAEATVAAIAAAGGDYPRRDLPTGTEYKKAKVRLFSDAFRQWEQRASLPGNSQ